MVRQRLLAAVCGLGCVPVASASGGGDRLNVTGDAALDGMLDIQNDAGFTLGVGGAAGMIGDSFVILTSHPAVTAAMLPSSPTGLVSPKWSTRSRAESCLSVFQFLEPTLCCT